MGVYAFLEIIRNVFEKNISYAEASFIELQVYFIHLLIYILQKYYQCINKKYLFYTEGVIILQQ